MKPHVEVTVTAIEGEGAIVSGRWCCRGEKQKDRFAIQRAIRRKFGRDFEASIFHSDGRYIHDDIPLDGTFVASRTYKTKLH